MFKVISCSNLPDELIKKIMRVSSGKVLVNFAMTSRSNYRYAKKVAVSSFIDILSIWGVKLRWVEEIAIFAQQLKDMEQLLKAQINPFELYSKTYDIDAVFKFREANLFDFSSFLAEVENTVFALQISLLKKKVSEIIADPSLMDDPKTELRMSLWSYGSKNPDSYYKDVSIINDANKIFSELSKFQAFQKRLSNAFNGGLSGKEIIKLKDCLAFRFTLEAGFSPLGQLEMGDELIFSFVKCLSDQRFVISFKLEWPDLAIFFRHIKTILY